MAKHIIAYFSTAHFRARFWCVAVLTVALALSISSMAASAGPSGMELEGVNISGAEWAPQTLPGVCGVNYIYPTISELDYFSSKGMKIIRVPFSWERMQPVANGPLEPTELGRLDAVISAATARGLSIVIDVHNYGAYKNITVGVPGGQPNSMFADFWRKMAVHYINNPKVIFGLMNEPVGSTMTATTWLASAQAAIDAIRSAGAGNLILVPSTYWGHPVNFVELNASVMINVKDPANNYSYDVHQYLDYDGSGTHTDCLSVSDAVATLTSFTDWLRTNHRTGFLSEIGVPSYSAALASLGAMLQYMHSNADVWTGYTYWSAGPWWQNYVFGVEPVNGQDTPQMITLINNLGSAMLATDPPVITSPPATDSPSPTPTPVSGTTKKATKSTAKADRDSKLQQRRNERQAKHDERRTERQAQREQRKQAREAEKELRRAVRQTQRTAHK